MNVSAIGDGIFAFSLVIFIIFGLDKRRKGLNLLATTILTFLIVQALKNIFNTGEMQFHIEELRPATQNIISSHTAVAFALAAFFILRAKRSLVKITCFFAATAVALCQLLYATATTQAVIGGILAGSFSATLVYTFTQIKMTGSSLMRRKSINRGSGLFSPAT